MWSSILIALPIQNGCQCENIIIYFRVNICFYFQWNMVTVVHVYNRWRTSEIRCYVNGELVSSGEMQWHVAAREVSTAVWRIVAGFLFE